MWRAAASLELLPIQTKTQLGDELIARISESGDFVDTGSVVPQHGLGARKLFYGPINQVLPASTGSRWLDAADQNSEGGRRGGGACAKNGRFHLATYRQRRWNRFAGRSLMSIWKRSLPTSSRRWARCSAKSCPPGSFSMNEIEIVDRIRTLSRGGARITLGIGDDCAIYRPRANEDLLFTTDQMIEGVHFLAAHKPDAVGERALARSLSDIAAMGGEPRFCLVALATPTDHEQWIRSFLSRPDAASQADGHRACGRRSGAR